MRLLATTRVRALSAVAAAALTIPLAAAPATAAGSAYGAWVPGGLDVPVTGFPDAALTSTSTSVTPAASAFLNRDTPFGAVYGSSRGQNYLGLRTAQGGADSLTTLAFPSPAPVGWGFALGDVDADTVRVTATGAGGEPLTAAQLGFQSSFNYCTGTPRPSCAVGSAPFTDQPVWNADTATLVGNGRDTSGASGWFRPTVPVRSLSLTFHVQTGVPAYQLWAAVPTADISGRITSDCGIPPGTRAELRTEAGVPVRDSSGGPVTAPVDADGTFSFTGVATAHYQVVVPVPEGYTASGPASRSVDTTGGGTHATDGAGGQDASTGDVSGVGFRIGCSADPQPPVTAPEGGGPVTVRLPADRDPKAPVAVPDPPAHGKVTRTGDRLVYVPAKGFHGTDSFIYRITRKDGAPAFVKVTVRVTAAKPKPHPAPPANHPRVMEAGGAGPELANTGSPGAPALFAAGLIGTGAATVLATAGRRQRGR